MYFLLEESLYNSTNQNIYPLGKNLVNTLVLSKKPPPHPSLALQYTVAGGERRLVTQGNGDAV